jgi:apolipoprotein N-acyltransferase
VVDVFQQTLDHTGTTLIAGVDEQDIDGFFNSVFVGHGQAEKGLLHRKNHLVPFGEYLPLRPILGKIDFIKNQLPGDFQAGHSHEPLLAPAPKNVHYSMIPLVCFEDTLGRLARQFVRAEPQIMINLTNDAWFDPFGGSHIHGANARLRTIELRRPLLRCTNTGLTCIIDAYGRMLEKLPTREPKTLISSVTLSEPKMTFYARHGDLFTLIITISSLLSLLYIWRRSSQRISGTENEGG